MSLKKKIAYYIYIIEVCVKESKTCCSHPLEPLEMSQKRIWLFHPADSWIPRVKHIHFVIIGKEFTLTTFQVVAT